MKHICFVEKIFESGSAASALEFKASRREVDWQNFVSGVPSCASLATSGNTFNCLKAANSSEIFSGVLNALENAPEAFGFDPTIDGPGGLFPDIASRLLAKGHFARLPFIAGTNLDEGKNNFNITLILAAYAVSLRHYLHPDREHYRCCSS